MSPELSQLHYEIENLKALLNSAREGRDWAIKKAEEKWVAAEVKLDLARQLEGKSFKDENDKLKEKNRHLLAEVDDMRNILVNVASQVDDYARHEYGL